jgi:hypothetical protein
VRVSEIQTRCPHCGRSCVAEVTEAPDELGVIIVTDVVYRCTPCLKKRPTRRRAS